VSFRLLLSLGFILLIGVILTIGLVSQNHSKNIITYLSLIIDVHRPAMNNVNEADKLLYEVDKDFLIFQEQYKLDVNELREMVKRIEQL